MGFTGPSNPYEVNFNTNSYFDPLTSKSNKSKDSNQSLFPYKLLLPPLSTPTSPSKANSWENFNQDKENTYFHKNFTPQKTHAVGNRTIYANNNRDKHIKGAKSSAKNERVDRSLYKVPHQEPLRIAPLRTQNGLLDTSHKTDSEKEEFEKAKQQLESEIFDTYNLKTEDSEGTVIDKLDNVLIPNANKIVALIRAGANKEAMLNLVEETAEIGPLNSHIWPYYDKAEKILARAMLNEYFTLTGIKREKKVKEKNSTYRC